MHVLYRLSVLKKGLVMTKKQVFLLGILIMAGMNLLCSSTSIAGGGHCEGLVWGMCITGGPNGAPIGIFYVNGEHSGAPACVVDRSRFVVDLRTEFGKAMYATAMAAYLSGRSVTVNGAGSCQLWSGLETAATMVSY